MQANCERKIHLPENNSDPSEHLWPVLPGIYNFAFPFNIGNKDTGGTIKAAQNLPYIRYIRIGVPVVMEKQGYCGDASDRGIYRFHTNGCPA